MSLLSSVLYITVPDIITPRDSGIDREDFANAMSDSNAWNKIIVRSTRPKGPSDDGDDLTSHGRVIKRFSLHRYQPLEFLIY